MNSYLNRIKDFVEELHKHILTNITFDENLNKKEEKVVKELILPRVREYLELYYQKQGIEDYRKKAVESLNWEGREGGGIKSPLRLFAALQYPDVAILEPFKIAIEYKQDDSGALIKQCIGQSLTHWLIGEYDVTYYLFCDMSKGKSIKQSVNNHTEKHIIDSLWLQNRTLLKIV